MTFDFILKYLEGGVHGLPAELKDQAEAVKRILTEGQGFLTKESPVKIVFFDEL